MDPSAAFFLFLLLILAGLAGLMLPKERPPKPPDEIHHIYKSRRD